MARSEPIDVLVCGPQLYAHNLVELRLSNGAVIYEPLEGEKLPAPEPVREVHYIDACGGLTLLVTDEGLYLSAGRLDPAGFPAAVKAGRP